MPAGGHMKKFPYRILAEWSEADECYVARVPAFPNLAAHGDTAAEATAEAQTAAAAMIDVLGDKAPASDNDAPSGNIRLRLPPYLHAALSRRATIEGVSLNQLMVAMLAECSSSVSRVASSERAGIVPPAEKARVVSRRKATRVVSEKESHVQIKAGKATSDPRSTKEVGGPGRKEGRGGASSASPKPRSRRRVLAD